MGSLHQVADAMGLSILKLQFIPVMSCDTGLSQAIPGNHGN